MSLVALSELLGAPVRGATGAVLGRVRELAIAPRTTRPGSLFNRQDSQTTSACSRAPSRAGRPRRQWSAQILGLRRRPAPPARPARPRIIDVHGGRSSASTSKLDSTPLNSHVLLSVVAVDGRPRRHQTSHEGHRAVVHAARSSAAFRPRHPGRRSLKRTQAPGQAEDRLRTSERTRPTSPTSSRSRRARGRPEPLDEVAAEALEGSTPGPNRRVAGLGPGSRHRREMDPDAAADLLGELPEARTGEILRMEPEERRSAAPRIGEHTAADRMTAEFVAIGDHGLDDASKRCGSSRAAARRSPRSTSTTWLTRSWAPCRS